MSQWPLKSWRSAASVWHQWKLKVTDVLMPGSGASLVHMPAWTYPTRACRDCHSLDKRQGQSRHIEVHPLQSTGRLQHGAGQHFLMALLCWARYEGLKTTRTAEFGPGVLWMNLRQMDRLWAGRRDKIGGIREKEEGKRQKRGKGRRRRREKTGGEERREEEREEECEAEKK